LSFKADKALKKRIVLLMGDEETLRRRALEALLAEAGVQRDDFDLEFTTGDATGPIEWFASAGTAPFMAERRIVVVRNLIRRDPEEAKTTDFKKLPESALLILVADEEGGSEDKNRRTSTWPTKWQNIVKAADGHVEAFKTDPKLARSIVKDEVVRCGKVLSEKALDTLLEMCGGSASRALDELQKLVVYSGDSEQIRENEIRSLVVPSRDWNVFQLIDAVSSNNVSAALRQLRILIGTQPRAEDAGYSRILPMLSRQLRLLWQARLLIDAGLKPANATPEIRDMLPEKPNILSEAPYRQSALMETARRTSLPRIVRALELLGDSDARLKGALPAFTGIETLERLVLEMAAALAGDGATQVATRATR
jgi:DNA polymerase III subunit delta